MERLWHVLLCIIRRIRPFSRSLLVVSEYFDNALYSVNTTSIDWRPGTEVDTDIFQGHAGGEGIVSVHRGFLLSYLALRGAVPTSY